MIVLDASIIYKWFDTNESFFEEARRYLLLHTEGEQTIVIPRLLFYEIANVLATKSKTEDKYISEILQKLYSFNLSVYFEQPKEIIETALLAKHYKTTVYDMLYAVIAKNRNILLITADETFIAKTHLPFVKFIGDLHAGEV